MTRSSPPTVVINPVSLEPSALSVFWQKGSKSSLGEPFFCLQLLSVSGVSASRWGRAIDEVQTVSCASQPWLEFLDFIPFGYSINKFPIASPHQRTVHKDETSQSRPSQASACTLEKTSFPNFNSHLLGGLYVSRPCVSLSKDPKRKSRALGQQTRDFITH